MFTIYGDRQSFYQWDLNQKLIVNSTSCSEVHFTNILSKEALVCKTYELDELTVVDVPNILLTEAYDIKAYIVVEDGGGCRTCNTGVFEVIKRDKPADYVYTETEVKRYEDLEDRLAAIEEQAILTSCSYGETDRYYFEGLEERLVLADYGVYLGDALKSAYKLYAEITKEQLAAITSIRLASFANWDMFRFDMTEPIYKSDAGSVYSLGSLGFAIVGFTAGAILPVTMNGITLNIPIPDKAIYIVIPDENYNMLANNCVLYITGGTITANKYDLIDNKYLYIPNINLDIDIDEIGYWESFDSGSGIRMRGASEVNSCGFSVGAAAKATGHGAFAMGGDCDAEGRDAKAIGTQAQAIGDNATAIGYYVWAKGNNSTVAGGYQNKANGEASFATNRWNTADGYASAVFGSDNIASGSCSFATGRFTEANGEASFAANRENTAKGFASAVFGSNNIAKGSYSFAQGLAVIATGQCQHVQGKYNVEDTPTTEYPNGKYAHIVGGGTSDSNRKNIHTVDWNGNAWYRGGIELNSPNGTRYRITVNNDGTLTTTKITTDFGELY